MIVAFEQLPTGARIWVFQADNVLSPKQQKLIESDLTNFLAGWQAHGQQLKTSFMIKHNLFLIIGVDETQVAASGCSIDKLTQFVMAIGHKIGADFFNRNKIVLTKQGQIPFLIDVVACETYFAEGTAEQFSFFNNVISTKYQLENEWLLPLNKSWIARKFQKLAFKSM
jgi:hypothetical protein